MGKDHFVSAIEQHLKALSLINDNQDISKITHVSLNPSDGCVTLEVEYSPKGGGSKS